MDNYKSSVEQIHYIELLSIVKKLESMRRKSSIHDAMFITAEVTLANYAQVNEDKIWNS